MYIQRMNKARSFNYREQLKPYALIFPGLFLLGLILIYPTIYNVILSFFSWRYLSIANKVYVGFRNFCALFSNHTFWKVTGFSFFFTSMVVVLNLLIGLVSAFALYSLGKGRRLITAVLILPYLVAPVAVGLLWSLMWNYNFGLINWILSWFGFGPVNWLGDVRIAPFAVIISEVWRSSPFATLVLMSGLTVIPMELREAARIDGASSVQEFFHVTLPLLRPSIAIVLLFQTIFCLRLFDLVYLLTGGGPGIDTMPYGLYIYQTAFRYLNGGQAATISVVLLFIGTIFAAFYLLVVHKEVKY
jgi:multiple sugar transport system permease protein